MNSQKKKTALVTGANRGIGRAIAEGLAARGCKVYLGVRTAGTAGAAIETIERAGGEAVEMILDVSSDDSVEEAQARFSAQEELLDILVNNAGIYEEESDDSTRDIPLQTFRNEFETNVLGPLRVSNAFYPLLRRAPSARVIHMSSRAGQLSSMDETFAPSYSVSKTALNALTRQQAAEFASDGIVLNCMSPGWVRTDMGGAAAERTPEQGADTAIWLALDCESGVSGRFFHDREEISW